MALSRSLLSEDCLASVSASGPAPRLVIDASGTRIAWRAPRGAKACVVVDRREGPEYDDIPDRSITFGPDGKSVAYAGVRSGIFTRHFVVINGQENEVEGRVVPESLCFSPDGQYVVWLSVRGNKAYFVRDGKSEIALDFIPSFAAFSPDGTRFAFRTPDAVAVWEIATSGLTTYASFHGFTKGLERLAFSPDSRRLGYEAASCLWGLRWLGIRVPMRRFVMVDGEAIATYANGELVVNDSIVFSPDSRRVAHAARGSGGCVVDVDGERSSTPYASVLDASLAWNPSDRAVAYAAVKKSAKVCAVIDGREQPEYDDIAMAFLEGQTVRTRGVFRYSADGRRIAYGASKDGKWYVVADGTEDGPYEGLEVGGQATFSSKGDRLAYGVRRNQKAYVVVNGTDGPAYDGLVRGGRIEFQTTEAFAYHAFRLGSDSCEVLRVQEAISP